MVKALDKPTLWNMKPNRMNWRWDCLNGVVACVLLAKTVAILGWQCSQVLCATVFFKKNTHSWKDINVQTLQRCALKEGFVKKLEATYVACSKILELHLRCFKQWWVYVDVRWGLQRVCCVRFIFPSTVKTSRIKATANSKLTWGPGNNKIFDAHSMHDQSENVSIDICWIARWALVLVMPDRKRQWGVVKRRIRNLFVILSASADCKVMDGHNYKLQEMWNNY